VSKHPVIYFWPNGLIEYRVPLQDSFAPKLYALGLSLPRGWTLNAFLALDSIKGEGVLGNSLFGGSFLFACNAQIKTLTTRVKAFSWEQKKACPGLRMSGLFIVKIRLGIYMKTCLNLIAVLIIV
jgi:hypothetical protein